MTVRHFVCRVPARTVTGTDWTAYQEAEKASRTHAERSRKMGAFNVKVEYPAEVWLRSSASQVYGSASPVQGSHDITWHRAGGSRVGPYPVMEVTKATAEGIRAFIQQQHNKPSPGPSLSYVDARHCDPFMVLADTREPTP